MRITLDPGHGQYGNPGVLPGYYEGTRVFMLAQMLKTELEKYNDTEVFITRKDIKDDPSLANRGKEAVRTESELFISLHSNAASSPAAHGVSVFRSVKRPDSEVLGKKLGEAVVSVMREKTDITYLRGVMTRVESGSDGSVVDYYGVIRNSVKSDKVRYSYIIEHGFHTNLEECGFMFEDGNLKRIADAEARVIAQYFGLKPKEDPLPDYIEYTVQPGDTLTKIARKYGTTWKILAEYNNLEDPDLIHTGQIILIPTEEYIKVGDTVRIKADKDTYFPDGKPFSPWVHDYDYSVDRVTDAKGDIVVKNGDRCVLLGDKINRKSGRHGTSINSWASVYYIEKVKPENKN